ncbi:hypothetical protein DAPPUDRAFT_335074 [Daphnia pulex]|uniref:PHD-type domain-containing protein n=1 Tax=Daphnia pulex TaxID=6669 RepID=E9HX07_DAPPU|nr:hypothetical protein DAPPUDRAFT_335074 [Daphnia pulex]|eukprot:EFX63728.1 hypothetical protein DAPPUDRAFT_335074 [Daphnia pulex]
MARTETPISDLDIEIAPDRQSSHLTSFAASNQGFPASSVMISNEIGLRVDTPISYNDVPQISTPLRKQKLAANKNIKIFPKKKIPQTKDTNEEDGTCSATICKMTARDSSCDWTKFDGPCKRWFHNRCAGIKRILKKAEKWDCIKCANQSNRPRRNCIK